MFGFGRKKEPPRLLPSNPGKGTEGRVTFSRADRTWTESFDLLALAAGALAQRKHAVAAEKGWIRDKDSGFALLPQIVAVEPLDEGGVDVTTTMQASHPALSPAGVFEYQHSRGDGVVEAAARGFDQWIQTDYVTLLDALLAKPLSCVAMDMTFPAAAGKPERRRRALLGPVAHYAETPAPAAPGDEHPFCSCCLLTKTVEAYRELIEGEGFFGLRLFAAREPGGPAADCRVNGEDWEKGAEALRRYAAGWAPAGYEYRKQYVVLQTPPAGA